MKMNIKKESFFNCDELKTNEFEFEVDVSELRLLTNSFDTELYKECIEEFNNMTDIEIIKSDWFFIGLLKMKLIRNTKISKRVA